MLTVFGWTTDVLDEWFTEGRPLFGVDGNPAAWPSERGHRVGNQRLNSRFVAYRDALGLDPGLDFHSFRRFPTSPTSSRTATTPSSSKTK